MANMHHMKKFWIVEYGGDFTPISCEVHEDGSPVLADLRKHLPDVYFERIDLHGGAGDWVGTLWVDEEAGISGQPGNAMLTDLVRKFAGRIHVNGNMKGRAILQCIEHFIVPA